MKTPGGREHSCRLPADHLRTVGDTWQCGYCLAKYIAEPFGWSYLLLGRDGSNPYPRMPEHRCSNTFKTPASRGASHICICGAKFVAILFDGHLDWMPVSSTSPKLLPQKAQVVEELLLGVELHGDAVGGVTFRCLHDRCPYRDEPLCYLAARPESRSESAAPVQVLRFPDLLIFVQDHLTRYHSAGRAGLDLWSNHG